MTSLSVLIVEDDAESAARLAADLTTVGHRVRVADSLDAAQALRTASTPDVIILDRLIRGRDTLADLGPVGGRLFPEPVLFLSGMAMLEKRIAGLDAGADDYLVKPAHGGEVEARLRDAGLLDNGSAELK